MTGTMAMKTAMADHGTTLMVSTGSGSYFSHASPATAFTIVSKSSNSYSHRSIKMMPTRRPM